MHTHTHIKSIDAIALQIWYREIVYQMKSEICLSFCALFF